jgi:hypothetical protein
VLPPTTVDANPFTSDRKEIAEALDRLRSDIASKPTAMGPRSLLIQWAAWLFQSDALQRANPSAKRKRAILLIAADDPRGWFPDEPLIHQLWTLDVALHVEWMPLESPGDDTGADVPASRLDNPLHIAEATGGQTVIVDRSQTLKATLQDLVSRIQSSYSLWYRAPNGKPGEVRHITVELSAEARRKYPGAQITARQGYIAH